MKKLFYYIAAATLLLFSACQVVDVQYDEVDQFKEQADQKEQVVFSAYLSADTKTYLEYQDGVYKTLWDVNDGIVIKELADSSSWQILRLASGEGTTKASFSGKKPDGRYIAYYGRYYYFASETVVGDIPYQQNLVFASSPIESDGAVETTSTVSRIEELSFPMAAVSDTTSMMFQNLASVIKLSVKGNGELLQNVKFIPNDTTIQASGPIEVILDGDNILTSTYFTDPEADADLQTYPVYKTVNLSVGVELTQEPLDLYLIVASQTYKGGFTLEFYTEDGYMDLTTTSDITLAQSELRAVPEFEYKTEYELSWGICGTMTDDWTTDLAMDYSDGIWKYIGLELEAGDELKFRYNGSWDTNIGAYSETAITFDSVLEFAYNGANFVVKEPGVYDIYLDRDKGIVTFAKSQVNVSWGICGTMTEWSSDLTLEYDGNFWVYEDFKVEEGAEFKLRQDGSWEVNYGAKSYSEFNCPLNTSFPILKNTPETPASNFIVPDSGTYDVYFDPVNSTLLLLDVESGVEYKYVQSYADLYYVKDDEKVFLEGYVFASYQRGFIVNIGSYYRNTALVYMGSEDTSDLYTPVIGNKLQIYAKKTTYNGLPELINVDAIFIVDDREHDYGVDSYVDLRNVEDFLKFASDYYSYVVLKGHLTKNGTYYNLQVGDQTDRYGSINYPLQDMTEFVDKEIYVEGYFIGFSGGGKYLNVVAKEILVLDEDTSTEDVIVGDDITLTSMRFAQ